MARYGFTSPGSNATDAIQKFLVQRQLQALQQQQEQRAQQEQQQRASQQAATLKLQQEQEARMAEAQKATQADVENQREFTRATTIADRAMPGDPADEATRALLEKQGYGGQIRKVPGIVAQGDFQGNDANDVPQYGAIQQPDSFSMRGGSQYLAARTAAEERAAEAEKNRTATGDRAESDRALKLIIAEMAASGKAGQTDLANQLKQIQIDREKEKLATEQQTHADMKSAVSGTRREVRDLAQSLLSDPALEGITGSIEGRRDTFFQGAAVDAKRRLDQLLGKLSLESRGKMKGQGQVSDFEGRLLANAVSAIDRAAGPEVVKRHLQEIVDAFQGDAPNSGPATNNTAGGGSDAAAQAKALIEKYAR